MNLSTSVAIDNEVYINAHQRRMAMFALMTAVTLASLDTTISNTALPHIVKDLQVAEASVIWVANAYQIAMIATLLPFSALGESIGYRRIYIDGLILFCIASLICGLATSLDGLVFGRVLQGIGAAAIMSVNTAFIRHIYPLKRLGRGLSLNALVVAVGFALGPLFASIILSFTTWHWLFLLNLPVGLIALILSVHYLPFVKGQALRFDILSGVLCTAFLGLFTFSLCSFENPDDISKTVMSMILSIACLLGLLKLQANHSAPILSIDLLRIPIIGLSSLTSISAFATQALAFISLPFLFQNTLGISLISIGFLLPAWPIVVAVMAVVVSPLSDRFSAGILCSLGLFILSLGMWSLTTLSLSPESFSIVWRLTVCGLGFGLFQAPNMKAIMSNAPTHRSGGASGIVAVSRLLGQTCGAALVAQCFHIWNQDGPEIAIWLGSICAALGCIFSLHRLKKPKMN
ncbi:MFS transporter [Acinetobacter sp. ANC 4173]|uniref:MFS transporter n=1 Tax=Acinetobacter sp. ANC 4173 TaxID=2529837 RepID=UPI00103FECC8|nr:MFS transporter [Acinetobacter sp. ANC 4173]TCB77283.1 MFS transporter [Acinetobacter sp. ANC 4173]